MSTIGASGLRPASTRIRSWRISPAVWYRLAGFLASALSVMESSSGGTVSRIDDGVGGSSRTCWYATDTGESPWNGGWPVSSSNSTQPAA